MKTTKRASYRISRSDHQKLKILAKEVGCMYSGEGNPAGLMRALAKGDLSIFIPGENPRIVNIKIIQSDVTDNE